MERRHRLTVAVSLLGLALVAACSVESLRLAVARLSTPALMVEYGESILLVGAEEFRTLGLAGTYRTDWDRAPLRVNPYPITMYALWAAIGDLTGRGADFLPGRIVLALAWSGVLVLLYAIPRRLGVGRALAAASALASLGAPIVGQWLLVARVDVPGIALGLLAFWLFLRLPRRVRAVAAVVALLASLSFKQSLAAAPAALVLHLLFEKRWREALATGAGVAGLAVLGALALDLASSGGFFFNSFGALQQSIDVGEGLRWTLDAAGTFPLPALAWLGAAPLLALGVRGPARLVLLYGFCAIGVAVATVGKVGANSNYLVEPALAIFLAAPVGVHALATWLEARRPAAAAWVPVVAILGLGVACLFARPGVRARLAGHDLVVASMPREVPIPSAEGLVMMNPGLLPLSSLPVERLYWNDPYSFSVYAVTGEFDPKRVERDLRSGAIGAIIENEPIQAQAARKPRFVGDYRGGWGVWSVPTWRDAAAESFERIQSPGFAVYRFVAENVSPPASE